MTHPHQPQDAADPLPGGSRCPTAKALACHRKDQPAAEKLPVRKAPGGSGCPSGATRRAGNGQTARRGKSMTVAEFSRLWLDPEVKAQDIADRLGVTVQAVRCRAMARGLPKRKGGGGMNRKIDPALFREMWAANVGQKAIAAFFGVHPHCVTKRRKEWGLPKRHCNRWNAISVAGFLLARKAREEQAALALAEMVDGRRDPRSLSGRRAA